MELGGKTWYTYAISFPNKKVRSIVSGTICNENGISIILVSKEENYEFKKIEYLNLIESFKCSSD